MTGHLAPSLVHLLRGRAAEQPDRVGYRFLLDGEEACASLTYGQLDRRARAVAARLTEMGLRGERALLVYPPGLEYISAFFGCLYAGVIAVPVYPPRGSRSLPRLAAIVADSQAQIALTLEDHQPETRQRMSRVDSRADLHWLATDVIPDALAANWQDPEVDGETIAFLQYTSGSTAAPRGVMVGHANVLHNERVIHTAFGHSQDSVVVGWLPLYHDMGLIGNVLQPLYAGADCVLMSPLAFLEQPVRWLRAISRFRGTTSGGPNFAYDLCARAIGPEQRATLDLSSWNVAFNGAEPVRAETLDRFAAMFADCGFRARAFYPSYGLAEATLFVTGGSPQAAPTVMRLDRTALAGGHVVESEPVDTTAQVLVGCGAPRLEHRVRIVEPESGVVRELDAVGEIWVTGPSVVRGYWNRPVESEYTFGAHLAGTDEGPFLRTGDLGFMRDGQLFVAGRLKDLIIIQGQNFYPDDLERTVVQSHPAFRPGAGAAFSSDAAGMERLVLVHEVERAQRDLDPEQLAKIVRQAIGEEHGLAVYAVVLVRPGGVPKTTSGKVQRGACRELWLAGGLPEIARSVLHAGPDDDALLPSEGHTPRLEAFLRERIGAMLQTPALQVDLWQPLAALGLDSLQMVELRLSVEAALGIGLPIRWLLEGCSISDLVERAPAGPQLAPISSGPLAPRVRAAPLSAGQRALWWLHQLAPESAAYNLASAARLHGQLDLAALQRAFDVLVERHAMLRTTFAVRGTEPIQLIHPHGQASLERQDASTWTAAALADYLAEQANRPFDLERGPLLRLQVLWQSDGEHVLLITAHHVVADYWSFGVLIRELAELYPAIARAPLAAVEARRAARGVEYDDYVRWQTELLAGAEGERLWEYWRRQLAEPLTALNLPTDRPRPVVQTYRGAAHRFTLGPDLSARVGALARSERVRVYTLLLAAFQVLLHRYSGQDTVLVGTPTSGRERAAFSNLVGYFANPVVLRGDFAGDPTFKAYLEQVDATVLGALEHQAYPFPQLVERLRIQREPSRSPVFQVLFAWHAELGPDHRQLAAFGLGLGGSRLDIGGLDLESIVVEPRGAQFDLGLTMASTDQDLVASLQYNTDLFDAARIARLVGHFQTLLEGIVAEPDRRVSALPLLTEVEHRQIDTWNQTATDYALDQGLHELVEAQVERSPDAIALTFEGTQLTYRELNGRANWIAARLQSMGLGPETLVGICLERSLELPIALLGILKAGAGYLPLDPSDPPARLAYILEDAGASVVLTQRSLVSRLARRECVTVCLDDADARMAGWMRDNVRSGVRPDNLAYVMYTSGSTGAPKGVMITHRGICNRLLWMQATYGLTAADGVLQKTSTSFDVSVWEFFWPLLAGARLVIARPGGQGDPAYLVRLIADQRITTVHFVPSLLRVFLGAPGLEAATSLRRVICSGEALPRELIERFRARLPIELHNLYGPTEASIDVTAWACDQPLGGREVPIGRPIANTRIELLDAAQQRVPVGVPGELHIGGIGLARGYLNRPGLTGERFIPDAWTTAPGARLYRTGDLARYVPDGTIEFLGRIDQQVKVRGIRVELGEVETVLAEHPLVREAVVLAGTDAAGETSLHAYVVAADGSVPSDDELQTFLRRKLPEAMVPATFARLDHQPLTPSGKLDRRALLALARPPAQVSPRELPATELERDLANIWQELLGVERVGRHADFFRLGGHSLLLAQLQVVLGERLQVEVALGELFEAPTVARMATLLAARSRRPRSAVTELVRHDPPPTEFELSYAQQPIFVLSQLKSEAGFFHMPVAIVWRTELPRAVVEAALAAVVSRHAALRTVFAVRDGIPVQVVAREMAVQFEYSALDGLSRAAAWARLDARLRDDRATPFALAQGPLVRAHQFRLPDGEQVVYLNVHHLAADGWSFGVIAREFTHICTALLRGEVLDLPRPAVEYGDYVRWEHARIASGALASAEHYWLRQMSEPVPDPGLPLDRERVPGEALFRGETIVTVEPSSLTTALREMARAHDTTLYTTLLTAYAILLHRLGGADEIAVGMPVSVRAHSALDDVVGCLVNVLPVRLSVSPDDSVGSLLRRVHGAVLGALNHRDYPLAMLLEKLGSRRGGGFQPLFSTVFLLQNFPIPDLTINGVAGTLLELEPDSNSKADLLWTFFERDNQLRCALQYDSHLFEQATARRILRQFERILEAVSRDTGQSIYQPSLGEPVEAT